MKDLIEIFAVNEEGQRELVKSQAIEYLWWRRRRGHKRGKASRLNLVERYATSSTGFTTSYPFRANSKNTAIIITFY